MEIRVPKRLRQLAEVNLLNSQPSSHHVAVSPKKEVLFVGVPAIKKPYKLLGVPVIGPLILGSSRIRTLDCHD